MTNQKKVGDFPTNARIKISYPEKGEPAIDFQYPDNERQIKGLWKSSGVFFPTMFLTILTIVVLYYLVFISVPIQFPIDCEGTFLTSNITHETYGINVFCNNITKYYHFQYKKVDFGATWVETTSTDNIIGNVLISTLIGVILYLVLMYVYGHIIAFFVRKTKFGKNNFPGWNQKIHDKHWEAKFTECSDSLTLEVPLFSNIYMDYEAEEEFSEYLESFEIKEHDFTYYPTAGFRLFKHRRKARKGVPNVYLWKAVFKFRKKPTKGFLKVNWT
jgi:hypothetical protein